MMRKAVFIIFVLVALVTFGCARFNPGGSLLGLFMAEQETPAPTPADTAGWSYRRKLTFNHGSGAENLQNFPVLLVLNGTNINYAATQSGGADLLFLDPDLTALDYEIESWNPGGDSLVWVRVPQIDALSTTDYVWMYYGNSDAVDRQNAAAVWSNGYIGVWHLDEDPSGSAPQIIDSSGAGMDGTSGGSMLTTDQVPGQIGGSLDFDGSNDYINFGSGCPVVNAWTVEFWLNPNSPSDYDRLFMQGSNACGSRQLTVYWKSPSNHLEIYRADGSGNPQKASTSLLDGRWSHFAWTYDGSSTHTIYIDGTSFPGTPSGGSIGVGGYLYMGRRDTGNYWHGGLDEFRLSTSARSADWIGTQYQSMINSLITFGAEEPAP